MHKINQIQVKYLWKDYFRGGGGIQEGDNVEAEGLAVGNFEGRFCDAENSFFVLFFSPPRCWLDMTVHFVNTNQATKF